MMVAIESFLQVAEEGEEYSSCVEESRLADTIKAISSAPAFSTTLEISSLACTLSR